MEDSLKKRYLIKLIANILNGLINIVIVAIVPKALGPISFGQFSYIQQFFTQFINFLDSGTSTAFFIKLSKDIKRKELLKFYFLYALSVLIITYLIIFSIDNLNYITILFPNIEIEFIYLGILFGFLVWFTRVFIYISDAYVLTVWVESFKIVHKILSLLLLIYFIYYLPFDLTQYFYFNYISLSLFIIAISFLFTKKGIISFDIFTTQLNSIFLIKEFFNFASPLVIFNMVAISFSMFDIWLLQKLGGSEQTGFYGLAYSISAMCFLFTSAMTPIITREFAKSFAEKNIKEMRVLFFKYIPIFYAIATYFSVFIAFQSENLLVIFTNHEFHDAYLVLMIMAYYPIHQTYGQLSGSIFYVTEQTKLIRNIGIISSILGFILTILFLYIFDLRAIGLAFKMVIIQIISVNIQLYFNSKFLDFKISYFIKHQIFSLLFFMLIAYITDFIVFPFSNKLIEFLVSGLIYTVFVLIGVIIAPTIFGLSKEEILSIKNYLKKIRIK